MFASLDVPDHPHRLPRPPVLGLGPVLVVDGGTAVQSQGSAREARVECICLKHQHCHGTRVTLTPLHSLNLLMGAHLKQLIIHGITLMHQPRSLPPLKSRLICKSNSSELQMVWSPKVTSGCKCLQERAELLPQFTALFRKCHPVLHVTLTPLTVLSQYSALKGAAA